MTSEASTLPEDAFRFRISRIDRLSRAGVGVFEGALLAGRAVTGQTLLLRHGQQSLLLSLDGVVLGAGASAGTLSLVFKLPNLAVELAQPGDELIGTSSSTSDRLNEKPHAHGKGLEEAQRP